MEGGRAWFEQALSLLGELPENRQTLAEASTSAWRWVRCWLAGEVPGGRSSGLRDAQALAEQLERRAADAYTCAGSVPYFHCNLRPVCALAAPAPVQSPLWP